MAFTCSIIGAEIRAQAASGMAAAFNDIGILTWPDGRTVIVAAFLTDSHAPESRRNALYKAIAGVVATDLHP